MLVAVVSSAVSSFLPTRSFIGTLLRELAQEITAAAEMLEYGRLAELDRA